jgi:hypothetical protein
LAGRPADVVARRQADGAVTRGRSELLLHPDPSRVLVVLLLVVVLLRPSSPCPHCTCAPW